MVSKAYYSSMVKSSAGSPQCKWNTINNILHSRSVNILASSVSLSVLACQFATFYKRQNFTASTFSLSPSCSFSSLSSSSNTSRFQHFSPTTVDEVLKLIHDYLNKQSSLDAFPTSFLKRCSYLLAPIITGIINLSLATGEFCPQLKHSVITSQETLFQTADQFPIFLLYPRLSAF